MKCNRLPYNGHWQDLTHPSSAAQALILLFSHPLAIYVSVSPLDSELHKNRSCVYLFATHVLSEHSALNLVGALAILIGCVWFLVARSSQFLLSQTMEETEKKLPLILCTSGYDLKNPVHGVRSSGSCQPGVLLTASALVFLQFVFISTHASSIKICHRQLKDIESNINAQHAHAFL